MKASEFLIQLKQLTRDDLISIKGIGEVLADNFVEFLESERYYELVQGFGELEKKGRGVTIQNTFVPTTSTVGLPLHGQIIVITGSFDISREQIKEQLEARGAKVVGSISSSTTLLLAGEKAGSKLAKAEKLGVAIATDYLEVLSRTS